MASDVLPLDIQELQTRLAQSEKERELLKCRDSDTARRLRSIAEGKSVSFFWDEVLKDCKAILPDAYVTLLTRAEGQEWALMRHDDLNTQLLTPNSGAVKLPASLNTFSQSPSCPIRQESNIQHASDWAIWHAFLAANNFTDAVMLNINEPHSGAYLMLVLQHEMPPLDDVKHLILKGSVELIEAAALREYTDQLLLEKGHFDPQTHLLRAFSFKQSFSMVLKDSRRHFMRVALISLKLRGALTSHDDAQLKDIASKIQTAVRDNDLVAYYGDGEFVMGVCIRNMQDAEVVASKLIKAISAPGSESNRLTKDGVRIGIAYYPEHSSLDDLHRAAEYAANSVPDVFGYRIEFHGAIYTTSTEFYTF
jgi:GGDEF domain-containing protein